MKWSFPRKSLPALKSSFIFLPAFLFLLVSRAQNTQTRNQGTLIAGTQNNTPKNNTPESDIPENNAITPGEGVWNQKPCAVALTYDDGIDADLDNIVPALDSLGLKGTFYLIGSAQVVEKRMNEWRTVAGHGHELGNHSLFHPCDGSQPGRSFVSPDNDLSRYTVKRAVSEIRENNVLLHAIDGKTRRTFAYPCGDRKIGDSSFYEGLRRDFAGARGTTPRMRPIGEIDLDNIDSYAMNGQTAGQMIYLVKKAMQDHELLVFLFHGVGGGHNLNVGLEEHSRLLHFLKAHENEIWIAPMLDIAQTIKAYQDSHPGNKAR